MAEKNLHADYAKELRGLLPEQAFQRNTNRLVHVLAHLAFILGCYFSLRYSSNIGTDILVAFLIGHSLACLAVTAQRNYRL